MARLIKYAGGLLLQGGSLASTASNAGEPDPGCCCVTCQGPCQWLPVWIPETGEWSGAWDLVTGCVPPTEECQCPEPTAESVGTQTYPSQAYWETPCGPPTPPGGCPPGGLCPCPESGVPPLFLTGWPGEFSVGGVGVYCGAECSYVASSSGSFSCTGISGTCNWGVSICAQITCDTIDPESGCGSNCSLSGVTVTVNTDSCDCPDELPDYSGFNYFYCP